MPDQQSDPTESVAVMEAHVQAVELPSWPLYGLDSPDRAGFLSGIGEGSHGLTSVRIDYRPPSDTERVIVQTTRAHAMDLEVALAALDGDEGQPLPLGDARDAVSGKPTEVLVDGAPMQARTRHGASAMACAVVLDEVVVLIVAANTVLTDRRLRRIDDLGPFKQARSEVVAAARRRHREE